MKFALGMLCCVWLFGSCQQDPAPISQVTIVRPSDVDELDPAATESFDNLEVSSALFETLLRPRVGGGVEPGLAESWSSSGDGKTWRFHLRAGVYFHDGHLLTSADVVGSFERQRDQKNPRYRPEFRKWQALFDQVTAVRAINQSVVEFELSRRYALFEENLTTPTAMVVRYNERRAPIGTGPFRLQEWQPQRRLVLARHESYWGAKPAFERVIFRVTPEASQRLIEVESGRADIATSMTPQELSVIRIHPEILAYQSQPLALTYLAMNLRNPVLSRREIREAIRFAVDKNPLAELVLQGIAQRADAALSPGHWAYYRPSTPIEYNPNKARAIITAAHLSASELPMTLYVPGFVFDELWDDESVARVIQSQLADVGIPTSIVLLEPGAYREALANGEHQLAIATWYGDTGDPGDLLSSLFDRDNAGRGRRSNVSFYEDSEVHALLSVAQESESDADRARYYARVMERVSTDIVWIPLVHSAVAVAARREMRDLEFSERGYLRIERLQTEKTERESP